MSGVCALTERKLVISFSFRRKADERFINLNQINRRGHSNATTKAYASSRPKTHRAHILCSTTTLYANPRDWSVQMGDDEVNHIVRLHREPELRTYIVSARGRRLNL